MKFKIFLLLFFSFGFFMSGLDTANAAEGGMCICDNVNFEIDPILGPGFDFNSSDVGREGLTGDSCKDEVEVGSGPLGSATTTYSGCDFIENACFCTVSTTVAFFNKKDVKVEQDKDSCPAYTYSGSILSYPVEYVDCEWYEMAEAAGVVVPSSGDPALPAVPTVVPTAPGALPAGGTTPGTGSSLSKEDAKTLGQKAAKGVTTVDLKNPLGEGRVDIRTILGDIVAAGMGILGSITLLVFVYGGFLWLTSAGSAEKVKKGSQTMMWAVVGLFLIFGSYAILGLVLEGIGAKQTSSSVPASTLNIPK